MRTLLVLVCLAIAAPANANFITIDPNAFPLGADLTHAFEGVTVSRLINGTTSPPYVFDPIASPVAVAGPHLFEYTSRTIGGRSYMLQEYEECRTGISMGGCPHFSVLEFLFDTPTNYFQIASVSLQDPAGIIAYDALGNRLTPWQSLIWDVGTTTLNTATGSLSRSIEMIHPWGPHQSNIVLTSSEPNIARVVYGGIAGTTAPIGASYEKVPEPSTLLMLSMGALILTRRKGKRGPPID